jgi:flagellar hook assembly protein FlgD
MFDLPGSFSLRQNYPNPFNPTTTISFELPKKSRVVLDIFNLLGRRVKALHDGIMPAGTHSIIWNGLNEAGEEVTSGIYFYRLRSDDRTACKKMVLLK